MLVSVANYSYMQTPIAILASERFVYPLVLTGSKIKILSVV